MKPLKSMTHEELQKCFAVQLELEALLGYEGVSRIIYDGPADTTDNWGAGGWLRKAE